MIVLYNTSSSPRVPLYDLAPFCIATVERYGVDGGSAVGACMLLEAEAQQEVSEEARTGAVPFLFTRWAIKRQ